MPLVIRAMGLALKNWKNIIGLWGLVMLVPFSFKLLFKEVTKSAIDLWWIAALAVLVILSRDFMKHYFNLKKKEASRSKHN